MPEVNPNLPENSQLLKDGIPDFANLTTEVCVSTIGKHLLDFEQGIRVIEQQVEKGKISICNSNMIQGKKRKN